VTDAVSCDATISDTDLTLPTAARVDNCPGFAPQDAGRFWAVSEYMPGGNLADLLRRHRNAPAWVKGRWPLSQRLQIALEVCLGGAIAAGYGKGAANMPAWAGAAARGLICLLGDRACLFRAPALCVLS
jgi:serine/threonine protein kinase